MEEATEKAFANYQPPQTGPYVEHYDLGRKKRLVKEQSKANDRLRIALSDWLNPDNFVDPEQKNIVG